MAGTLLLVDTLDTKGDDFAYICNGGTPPRQLRRTMVGYGDIL